ncbi:MBL fold metallo-hydrolase [Kitasatospora cystarginea]|uniref:MBL fold metallo-hydrolase n=1 Tax=Kitasatospora cystarginea TaxID=58350 RepID=A0ABN3ELH2_9ACTN
MSRAQLLAPGVRRIATSSRDAAFLVEGEDGLTLVDVGWASAHPPLLTAIEEIGHKPHDVKRIVLTHAHPDHVQGAAYVRELTGAAILAHPAEHAWLAAGHVPREGRSGTVGRMLDRLPKLHWKPFTPDQPLNGGERVDGTGLLAIHTPGHSPGHLAFLHEPTGTVLVGDAVFHRGGLTCGPAALAADPGLRAGSLRRLPPDISAVGFAHGPALTRTDEVEAFHAWLESLPE